MVNVTTVVSGGKDSADQELFDFLNEQSSATAMNGSDRRPSSSASSQSQKTPELPLFVADVGVANGQCLCALCNHLYCYINRGLC